MHVTFTKPLQSEVSSYATVISIQRYLATGTANGHHMQSPAYHHMQHW